MNSLKASIIVIGTELTKGLIQDVNAYQLAKELTYIGVKVSRIIIVPDDKEEIEWALKKCLELSDVVITTGGLGFTEDDVTIEAAASTLGLSLKLNTEALEMIKSRIGGEVKWEVKAAYLPIGSKPLYNRAGISPGVYVKVNDKHLFLLPGVPIEVAAIFQDHVKPFLEAMLRQSVSRATIVVETMHEVEAEVDEKIRQVKAKYPLAYFKTHAVKPVKLVITVAANRKDVERLVNEILNDLKLAINIGSIEVEASL
ncbi:MAG: competence/damage-inducible protein A [Desulfurococcaceae archaeon]|nr:competence/damage-inducible protein A [Sulfolobales archaeon]MDW8169577.1 competence/damage-inducible protein A [Desulfurococcaceae archaeon]